MNREFAEANREEEASVQQHRWTGNARPGALSA